MPQIDIIYNSTLLCPWDCAICCVDAIHVKKKNNNIVVRSEGLTKVENYDYNPTFGNSIENVFNRRKKDGLELGLQEKIKVLEHLNGFDVKIDISGGDPLTIKENFEFLKIASATLGRNNITLTATGLGLSQYTPAELYEYIGEFNFTYDANSNEDVVARPLGYSNSNLDFGAKFAALGGKTRAEFPLNKNSISLEHLTKLYKTLNKAKIDKLLIMRLFPVGRGVLHSNDIPDKEQYIKAITILLDLESLYKFPRIKLQCALKHLGIKTNDYDPLKNPCDLVNESFGLMADGTLLASPWAVNAVGKPLHDSWVLGNLHQTPLSEILSSSKVSAYREKLNENFGHCKIFSYLNSNKLNEFERIFDKSDPLYQ